MTIDVILDPYISRADRCVIEIEHAHLPSLLLTSPPTPYLPTYTLALFERIIELFRVYTDGAPVALALHIRAHVARRCAVVFLFYFLLPLSLNNISSSLIRQNICTFDDFIIMIITVMICAL